MQNATQRRAFLEARRAGLGGSDISALVGVHPFGKTAVQLWEEKTQPLPEGAEATVPLPAQRGIALEPIICEQYEEMTGYTLVAPHMAFCHPDYPHLRANPDRIVVGEWGLMDAKAPGLDRYADLKYVGMLQAEQLQGQHYLLVLGSQIKWIDFRFFNSERWQGINVRQEPDTTLQAGIVEIGNQFWNDYVMTEIPPDNDTFTLDIPQADSKITVIEDEERLEALFQLRHAKILKKQVLEMEETSVTTMKTLLGALGTYVAEGDEPGRVHKLQYTESAGRRTFDDKLLATVPVLDPALVQTKVIELANAGGYIHQSVHDLLEHLKMARLDLERFYKQGDPFTTLRLYPNSKR